MAAVDVDVVESALRDVSLSSGRETVLKPEQESVVRDLLADRDVLAVLRTGYGKSLIYQTFVRAKNYELNGNAAILVISPMKSIIEDQLQEMELLGYPAKDLANLSNDDIRRCNLAIKEGGFTSRQNAAYSNKVVFICWVDYALEGSAFIYPAFILSKCYFSRMFHTERS
ncbi:unnamed protein product [Porites lobata]|uniref:DEAD/DEAH-box helicase domain-containing protein n=1 Tax=Porites lobata TaxID=104759 RepID=A0ABN8RYJ6_9CNID|nr:unnamed protein product [Porites lobata]